MSRDPNPPIVCNMTDAPDTGTERLAEYHDLFTTALVGRERANDGIRFRFRADPGLFDKVQDLAAREKACCAFFVFDVREVDGEVWWDSTVIDDAIARQILDEMYQLPESAGDGLDALFDRFSSQGLDFVTAEDGVLRPATAEELGLRA